MILAYKSWLTSTCCICQRQGRHKVIFGRSRCVDCRREDSKVVADSAERFPKFGTLAEELAGHLRDALAVRR
jgi:hypothetical protein